MLRKVILIPVLQMPNAELVSTMCLSIELALPDVAQGPQQASMHALC